MAEDYLDHLSKQSSDASGKINVNFHDHWRKQLSVTVQMYNARVIIKKLSKLSA